SPWSLLPQASTAPLMLQMRLAEFGGPQMSLYWSSEMLRMCMYSVGGLPLVRHTSVDVSPPGSGKRLSMAPTPPCSAVSKSPMVVKPPRAFWTCTSSRRTGPRPNELKSPPESAPPRFVFTRKTRRTVLPPPRIEVMSAPETVSTPEAGVASDVSEDRPG